MGGKGEDERFLRDFFRSLSFDPIEEPLTDPRYFRLYEHEELAPLDPIRKLETTIRFSSTESAQLFSGFRGTGKSTELRRLKSLLREDPKYKVALCDMKGYLNETMPLDISDFLMAVAGALSDELKREDLLGEDPSRESFWRRAVRFFKTARVEVDDLHLVAKAGAELGIADASSNLKLSLKSDPSFRALLQERMRNHLGAFTEEVHRYVQDCLQALRERHGEESELVLILDSVEHTRGTSQNHEEVANSIESVFHIHADKLHIEWVHLIYTVPPWLRIKSPGAAQSFDSYQHIHCVKTRSLEGSRFLPGYDALAELVRSRHDWEPLLGDRATLDRLIEMSGGYIRDLFRLIKDVLLGARTLPASSGTIDLAISELRNHYPFTNEDAVWLERIESSGEEELDDVKMLERLARFFDTHLVLGYRNGGVWYGVHPVIRDQVTQRATRYRAREESG